MRKLAITGGAAEGKTTVVSYLAELGYSTASSDVLARQVFDSDRVQSGLSDLLGEDGPITAETLRARIWDNSALRRAVNRLMHPLILERIENSRADVIEVPLLIETCLQGYFERVWVVTCGLEEQRRRLVLRLRDEDQADRIISTQLPSDVKCAFADVVVRTNRALEDVNRFVATMARRSLG